MPSELDPAVTPDGPGPTAEAERPERLAWLRSQGLGIICGLSTVVLLAIGSFVMAATREGASAGIAMDDLRPFFERPSLAHFWLYLLIPVSALYAVNTAYATWHSVVRKLRAGVRAPSAYAPSLMHIAFLLALIAHGVGGLWGGERGQVVIGPDWQRLPDGREVRVVSLDTENMPNGMPKRADARIEVRGADGTVSQEVIGYNAPLSTGFGSDLGLLTDYEQTPTGVRLTAGGEVCVASRGLSCSLGGREIELLGIAPPGHMGSTPAARLRVRAPGSDPQAIWMAPGGDTALPDGFTLRLEAYETQALVLLRLRHAPGNPWALASAVLMAAGVLLMWRRFRAR